MTTRFHYHAWRHRGIDPDKSALHDFAPVRYDCRCGAVGHWPLLADPQNWFHFFFFLICIVAVLILPAIMLWTWIFGPITSSG